MMTEFSPWARYLRLPVYEAPTAEGAWPKSFQRLVVLSESLDRGWHELRPRVLDVVEHASVVAHQERFASLGRRFDPRALDNAAMSIQREASHAAWEAMIAQGIIPEAWLGDAFRCVEWGPEERLVDAPDYLSSALALAHDPEGTRLALSLGRAFMSALVAFEDGGEVEGFAIEEAIGMWELPEGLPHFDGVMRAIQNLEETRLESLRGIYLETFGANAWINANGRDLAQLAAAHQTAVETSARDELAVLSPLVGMMALGRRPIMLQHGTLRIWVAPETVTWCSRCGHATNVTRSGPMRPSGATHYKFGVTLELCPLCLGEMADDPRLQLPRLSPGRMFQVSPGGSYVWFPDNSAAFPVRSFENGHVTFLAAGEVWSGSVKDRTKPFRAYPLRAKSPR